MGSKIAVLLLCLVGGGALAPDVHSQPNKDIFTDTFITGLTDSTVLFPWGSQICDTSERVIQTHGIGKSYDKRLKILPNTARNGSTALWVRSRDGAWIVIQSNNVHGGRTCIAAKGDAGTKLPKITIGRPAIDEPGNQAPAAPTPASAFAQGPPPSDAYDQAGKAVYEYACAAELRQVNADVPGSSTFGYWKDQFRDWRAPGVHFEQIRTENRPKWISSHYLAACAALTYVVVKKDGVGSGKEALVRWKALRASFENSR